MNHSLTFFLLLVVLTSPIASAADRTRSSELPPEVQAQIDQWMAQVKAEDERRAKLIEAGVDPATFDPPEPPPYEVMPPPPAADKPNRNSGSGAIPWPKSGAAPMDAKVITYLFDGYPITRMLFSNGSWMMTMPVPVDFAIHPERGPASVRMQNVLFPNTEIQFSFFAEDAFLPDLEPSSIEGYIKGLQELHGQAIRLPEEPIAANVRVPINGSIWWSIPYTLVDPNGQETDVSVVDYIFKVDPYLIVVRHRGPARIIRSGTPMLQDALIRCSTPSSPPQPIVPTEE